MLALFMSSILCGIRLNCTPREMKNPCEKMLTSELKTINLQRHASRVQAKVEKVWAQLTNPSPNILTKLGVPNLA